MQSYVDRSHFNRRYKINIFRAAAAIRASAVMSVFAGIVCRDAGDARRRAGAPVLGYRGVAHVRGR